MSRKVVAVLGATLVAASIAAAQTPPPQPTPAPRFGLPRSEEEQNLSAPERVARGASHLERMRSVLKTVLKYLEEAREKRDVIKLNCVNEKLTAVKGLLKMSEQADVSMQEALARRDEETGRDEYDKISIARGKVDQLLTESEGCVGELSVYSGDTIVEMVGGDTGDIPSPPPVTPDIVVRPPAASNGENG
ncbi:MAG: hypothetical protein ACAI38_23515 [Myxococcota bacterium]